MQIHTGELATLQHDAKITLFEVDLNPRGIDYIFYLSPDAWPDGSGPSWGGIEYVPIPCRLTGEKIDSPGQSPKPVFEISNAVTGGILSTYLLKYQDLVGAKITRRTTYKRHLDGQSEPSPYSEFEQGIYTINRKTSGNALKITLELSVGGFSSGTSKIPRRVITTNVCWWEYRGGDGCPYTGVPISDKANNPLNPVRVNGCAISSNGIVTAAIGAFAAVVIGDTVRGANVPNGSKVLFKNATNSELILSMAQGTHTGQTLWFAPDNCAKLWRPCAARFGRQIQAVVTPSSAILDSAPGDRGGFVGYTGCFIHTLNLASGFPVAAKILQVLPSLPVAIASVSFESADRDWVFATTVAHNLSVGCTVMVTGVHPLIDGRYTLLADSFTSDPNIFKVGAKPQALKTIEKTTTTVLEAWKPHGLVAGNFIYIAGVTAPNDTALNGLKSVVTIPTDKIFTVGVVLTTPYGQIARPAFSARAYVAPYSGLGAAGGGADNTEAVFYFAPSLTPSGATVVIENDRLLLDRVPEPEAIAGTYNFVVGGDKIIQKTGLPIGAMLGATLVRPGG
jgi:lambda family phage minor tail protein L